MKDQPDKYKITLQDDGKTFAASADQTVLEAALDAGIVLPYSCRDGNCSSCRGRIVVGEFDAGPAPARILDETDLVQGYTLLCQAKPQSDLLIDAREVCMDASIQRQELPVRVRDLQRLAPDVMEIVLQLPVSRPFNYYPGQYLDFVFPDGTRRSYSIADAAVQDHRISLHVRHVPGGYWTDRLFGLGDHPVRLRDILRVDGPLGSFFVRPELDRPILFLASGTGFAPVKAMVEHMLASADQRPARLYWGGRRPTDLYAMSLACQWPKLLPDFQFVPVVSDPQAEDDWQGRAGWVHRAAMIDLPDMSAWQVYACGNPAMVEAARHDFIHRCALPAEFFFADAFTTEADRALMREGTTGA